MKYKYGDFQSDGSFKIEDPDTPMPWINYLSNGDYCALVSQHGGGFSFYEDPARHGTLRREYSGIQRDCPGRFFYIVDEKHRVAWSPNRVPMDVPLEDYSCVHEPGFTRINSLYQDVECEIEYFVPPGEDHEIWSLSLENHGEKVRQLRVVALGEWLMGNTERDATDRKWDQLFRVVRFDEENEVLLGNKRHWETLTDTPREVLQWPYTMYMASTRSPRSWDACRRSFFGSYRSYHNPEALQHSKLAENEAEGKDTVGAMDWKLELEPDATETISTMVGVVSRDEANGVSWSRFQDEQYVESARRETQKFWDERQGHVKVDLPDEDLQHLVNTWLPYQVTMNTWFGRAPSFWHSSQGYTGFRDACHESYGCSPFAPEDARKKIKHILSFTYESGLNSHRTPRGARDRDESDNADDPLWVPLALNSYLKETGDLDLLDEKVEFLDSDEKATVIEHMVRGLDYVLTQRGDRGLPLIRYGDWNDALDTLGAEGEGESVWIGQFLCMALDVAADIMEQYGYDADKIKDYREKSDEIRETINSECWDGDWYLRAFTDSGRPIGSSENSGGQLYLNTQTWAVLGGVAPSDRAEKAFEAVQEKLDTEWGFRYFAPAYDEIDPEVGVITQFFPGKKENGSIFSHAAAFSLAALAELGRSREAYELWKKISPTTHARVEPDHYRLEPYVYCQNVTGPDSTDFGQGNYHWLSGTASWVYRGVLDYILGLKPAWDGLRIEPQLPPDWEELEVTRDFRGVTWNVKFHQDSDGSEEVQKLIVDGQEHENEVIPVPEDKSEITVEVFL